MAMPMTAVAHGVTCGIELLLTEYKKGQIGHFAVKANALFAYIQTFTYLYAVKNKQLNSPHTMKRILSLCLIALMGLYATAQSITTASSSMTASPWTEGIPYDITAEGKKQSFVAGMGGWSWDFFAYKERNWWGKSIKTLLVWGL